MRAILRLGLASFPFLAFTLAWGAPRSLSFEERVEAQQAIERVYHSHQTGAALRACPEYAAAASRRLLR